MVNYEPISVLCSMYDIFEDPGFIKENKNNLVPTLLSSDEFNQIMDKDDKFYYFLFLIKHTGKDPSDFMIKLQIDYSYLYEAWNTALKKPTINVLEDFSECIKNSQMPKNHDLIVHRMEYLWEIHSQLLMLKREKYLVLAGDIGYGKETLAMDAVNNYFIAKKMGFKIFWLNLRNCPTPENRLQKLIELKDLLGDSSEFKYNDDTNSNILRLKRQLQNYLNNKPFVDCLIVLCGVENVETIDAFDLNCKIFITTRHKNVTKFISEGSKTEIPIKKGFTLKESEQFLLKNLKKRLSLESYERTNLKNVLELCNGHPLIITIIFKSLSALIKENAPTDTARWDYWIDHLNNNKKLDINKTIQNSLSHLNKDICQYYYKLVIFPHSVDIPIACIRNYWGTDLNETNNYIDELNNVSLLQFEYNKNGNPIVQFDYANYIFLQHTIPMEEKQRYHKEFVDKYRLDTILLNRSEPRMIDIADDNYIYYFIGYHIKESGMTQLFPKLYFDLGFLEKLLRCTRLPNVVGDLKKYCEDITCGGDVDKAEIVDELHEFLPSIEEIIDKSTDSCLIQCALNFGVKLRELALKQMHMFPNLICIADIDHSDKLRQIVHLQRLSKPVLIKIYSGNKGIVALQDNTIIIQDFSPFCFVEPTIYRGHKSKIIDIIILTREYFISLDESGIAMMWFIRTGSNYTDQHYSKVYNPQKEREDFVCAQEIYTNDKLTCMHASNGCVYFGSSRKEVLIYKFEERKLIFKHRIKLSLTSNLAKILTFTSANSDYLLLIDQSSKIKVLYLQDDGEVDIDVTTGSGIKKGALINAHICHNSNPMIYSPTTVLLVMAEKVIKATFQLREKKCSTMNVQYTEFNLNSRLCPASIQINCSHLMESQNILMLGTTNGYKIYDVDLEYELFRKHVSDSIKSVDSLMLKDKNVKTDYQIASCTENSKEIIYVSKIVIPKSANVIANSDIVEESSLEWYEGAKLYDIVLDTTTDDFLLYAVDSSGVIHKSTSENDYTRSVNKFENTTENKISMISASTYSTFVVYDDNSLRSFNNANSNVANYPLFDKRITYVKAIDLNLAVVGMGSQNDAVCKFTNDPDTQIPGSVVDVFHFGNHIILVMKKSINVYNFQNKIYCSEKTYTFSGNINAVLATKCGDTLYVIATNSVIYEFNFDGFLFDGINLNQYLHLIVADLNNPRKLPISSFTVHHDKHGNKYYALGCSSGEILLKILPPGEGDPQYFTINNNSNAEISQVLFYERTNGQSSPILVAASDEIIFWDVITCRRNFEQSLRRSTNRTDSLRQSQRFKDTRKRRQTNDSIATSSANTLDSQDSKESSGILCCVNIIGKSVGKLKCNAEQNKFLTMDNEGNVHYLRPIVNSIENDLRDLNIEYDSS